MKRKNFIKKTVVGGVGALIVPTFLPSYVFGKTNANKKMIVGEFSCDRIIKPNIKIYNVNKIEDNLLIINGKANDSNWEKANLLTDFSYPWNKGTPPKTAFKALWNSQYFYFSFKTIDKEIILIRENDAIEEIISSDRVELFFKKDDDLNPYYCLEMDSAARVMDFRAYPNSKFQFDWKWPLNGLELKSSLTEEGYIVEGSISLGSLKYLNLMDGSYIKAGIFRANYHQSPKGLIANYISWVLPDSTEPNFHIPSSFGLLHLQK